MGYTTDFMGEIEIVPALNQEEIDFLTKFSETRRMDCEQGPYYVDRGGFAGQANDPKIRNYNRPPEGQPSLWCQWIPTDDGESLVWDQGEKFYESPEWMAYLIEHFLGQNPKAKNELPFLQGHVLNGTISAQGEDPDDKWLLHVRNNKVFTEDLICVPDGTMHHIGGDGDLKEITSE